MRWGWSHISQSNYMRERVQRVVQLYDECDLYGFMIEAFFPARDLIPSGIWICVPTLMFSKMVNAAALSASAVSVYGALGCPQCDLVWSNDHW